MERVAEKYGVSPGTISNYFRHVLFGLHKSLKSLDPQLIRWPNVEEGKDMEGLIIGFSSYLFFFDGNNNKG